MFLAHVEAHSPDKPETVRRYRQVIEHFERHLAHGKYVEAISRADIDEYKIARCGEKSEQHDWQITASTVNFEVGTLHKFRHTYGTRLVEKGTNIVTVQRLMGHSDIKTTLKYLNPEDALKRQAANRPRCR